MKTHDHANDLAAALRITLHPETQLGYTAGHQWAVEAIILARGALAAWEKHNARAMKGSIKATAKIMGEK